MVISEILFGIRESKRAREIIIQRIDEYAVNE